MNQQIQSRVMGERRAALSLRQLMCAVFIWRRVMTDVLPICTAAVWWMALLCLLPGIAAAVLLRATMHLTGASTVSEAVRACLGKMGAMVFSTLLAALLITEGISTLTALLTVFTQGVGTRGTQFTLAFLTGAVLLCSLTREGLPRAVYMLRWGMLALLAVVMVSQAGDVQISNLFPLHGGDAGLACKGGYSLGWPLALLLTVPPCGKRGRLCSGIEPVGAALGLVFLTLLTMPREILWTDAGLAECLLLPIWYQPNAVRVAGLCLLMLSFFLALGGAVQLAAEHLLAPYSKKPFWVAYAVLGGVVLTQAGDIPQMWYFLRVAEAWLLPPLAAGAVISMLTAICRRRKA